MPDVEPNRISKRPPVGHRKISANLRLTLLQRLRDLGKETGIAPVVLIEACVEFVLADKKRTAAMLVAAPKLAVERRRLATSQQATTGTPATVNTRG